MNVRLTIFVTSVLIILIYNIGCVNTPKSELSGSEDVSPPHPANSQKTQIENIYKDKDLARNKIGRPTINYGLGDVFSSGTIEWEVTEKGIKSKDGTFLLNGPKDSRHLKQFYHAIPQALELIRKEAPDYYKIMEEFGGINQIHYKPGLDSYILGICSPYKGNKISDAGIATSMVKHKCSVAALAALLIEEVVIANEQRVTGKIDMSEKDQDFEATLHILKFFKDIGITVSMVKLDDGADYVESRNKLIIAYGDGYFNFITKLNSKNNPELANLKKNLMEYRLTNKVSDLSKEGLIEGLIEHFNEYVIAEYPAMAIGIYEKYDPERAEIEGMRGVSEYLKDGVIEHFIGWALNLDPVDNPELEQIQSDLEKHLKSNNDEDFPIPGIARLNLYGKYIRSESYKDFLNKKKL